MRLLMELMLEERERERERKNVVNENEGNRMADSTPMHHLLRGNRWSFVEMKKTGIVF